jgi:hypothetical protein
MERRMKNLFIILLMFASFATHAQVSTIEKISKSLQHDGFTIVNFGAKAFLAQKITSDWVFQSYVYKKRRSNNKRIRLENKKRRAMINKHWGRYSRMKRNLNRVEGYTTIDFYVFANGNFSSTADDDRRIDKLFADLSYNISHYINEKRFAPRINWDWAYEKGKL